MVIATKPAQSCGTLLRDARKRRGWSQPRLAIELRRIAGRHGRTLPADSSVKRRIASWENGHSAPEEFYGPLLCEAFGLTAAALGLKHLTGQDAALLDTSYPASPDTAIAGVDRLWRADLNGYEPLLEAGPSEHAWSEASLRWLVAPEASFPSARGPEAPRVGLGDVTVVKSTSDMFAQLDDRFGGEHARQSVIQYLSQDVAPLLKGTYTESVGRALFSTVAECTLLAGWMSYDACHHGLAQRYFLQALRFAQDGNDRRLAGSILSAMSHQATFVGEFVHAATLARAALMGISGVATPTLRAQFHAMEARALARTGDRRGCEAALAQAAKHLESRNSDDEPEWITYFDEAELAAEAAHCFRDVRSARQAVAYAENAMSGSHVRSDFFATMVLADAHLHAKDPEEACRVALDALDLGEQLRSARCVAYLAEFRGHLDSVGDCAAVRDFHEQVADHRLWAATEKRMRR
ncbi:MULTISPECIES: helix-turn-helix domain-containing protein [Streptomycetaceae]|uniref:Regulator n=1 Tax=Streptantibioticus cattleyicolor (strain ATCC 35852 / DSM 46488 / JCM 4925 / NBRC 14057 / NRRL 8057) TaxID=1003195 RepID=F8K2W1_STREN|nr:MULTISPECIES: transcriptional regulator [Streptomycetaceae]AEW95664.1 regulator [Streptantibioticus cattleyicolor NRRL 8057 = DSM 46488]MYS60209.1 transcriptional regulator [Streptomyces sp. SID5468]CCB75999.1 putative Regulator [Streptantibioticus cattleyicolor NRRL 8057 = DSM 46488]